MSTKQLVDEGEKIIFGGIGKSKARGAVGRGQCPLCHATQEGMLGERAPNLFGLPQRALARLKDPRYHLGNQMNATRFRRKPSLALEQR